MTAEQVVLDAFTVFLDGKGGTRVDTYDRLAELRSAGAVQAIDAIDLLGAPQPPGERGACSIFGYEEAAEALRDNEAFSNSWYRGAIGRLMGRTVIEMDPPEHAGYRSLINAGFLRRSIEEWSETLIPAVVDSYIDRFVGDGRADLMTQFHLAFPVTVIAALLGIPDEDLLAIEPWAFDVVSPVNWERAVIARDGLGGYFQHQIERRRAEPTDDIIGLLARSEVDGQRLTDEEIISFLRLLFPSGAHTTAMSTASMLLGLLRDREQFDAVHADRSLLPQVIDEGLRWEPPLVVTQRQATRGLEFHGVAIPEGGNVQIWLGAANRDPLPFPDPDRFDIFRPPQPNLGFGWGSHLCIGMHLARAEARIALDRLVERLPNLRLDPDAPGPEVVGVVMRCPSTLPVVFDET
jgi:cytochrome P450